MAVDALAIDPRVLARLRAQRGGMGRALGETCHVIGAMVMRDALSRYGGSRLGYLWAFIEPLMLLGLFLAIRTFINDRVPFGESVLVFMASGFLTLRVALSIASKTMASLSSQNTALLTFPTVLPLDLVLSRVVIEMVTMATVMAIFYALVVNVSDVAVINDPVDFTAAVGALFLLAGGVGCFNAVMAALWAGWGRIFSVLSLPLLLASGIFYLPASMAPEVLEVLSWNPLLHCVEWFREAIYLDYISVLDRSYPLVFGAVALGAGVVMARLFRSRLAL